MDAQRLFLEQYDLVHSVVEGFVLGGLSEDQLPRSPRSGQNSLAWLLWHATRWEDVVMNAWVAGRPQVLDREAWLGRLNAAGREVGTGMTEAECAAFNARADVAALRAYREAVGRSTREIAGALPDGELGEIVDEARLRRAVADGASGNARAPWLDQFFAGKTKAWFLAFLNVHNAEHLIGEALSVRSLAGIPLGL